MSKSNLARLFGLKPIQSEDFAGNLQQLQRANSPVPQPAQEFQGNSTLFKATIHLGRCFDCAENLPGPRLS
jgi:hypothetical protein